MEKQKYKKRSNWQEEAENCLLQLWDENIDSLRGSRKNSHIYEEISKKMKNFGYYFTSSEIKIKIQNLTSKYRSERKMVGPSGGSPSTWKYYDKVHSIIGYHKCNVVEDFMEDNLDTSDCTLDVLEGYENCCDVSCTTGFEEMERTSLDSVDNHNDSSSSTSHLNDNDDGHKRSYKRTFQQEILQLLKGSKEVMVKDMEERRDVDAKMLKLQEELVQLEKRKVDIFEKMAK